jgi:hypothetical protein
MRGVSFLDSLRLAGSFELFGSVFSDGLQHLQWVQAGP